MAASGGEPMPRRKLLPPEEPCFGSPPPICR
jgi:hypothetical protein